METNWKRLFCLHNWTSTGAFYKICSHTHKHTHTRTHTLFSLSAMCLLPPSNPRLSNPRVVPPRCHLPLWLSPAHVLPQSCQTENYLISQRCSSRSNEGEFAREPLKAAITHNINLLFPQHPSIPLEMATLPRLRCQPDTDRSPLVWVSSRVRPPYQLLASRSPSGKFQDSFMHLRGI